MAQWKTLGKYEVGEQIASFPERTVFRGTQKGLTRDVYLVVTSLTRNDSHVAQRLKEETRLLASFNHWGLPTIYDFGEVDGACFYATQAYLPDSIVETVGGRDSESNRLEICCAVIEIINYLHDQGYGGISFSAEDFHLDSHGTVVFRPDDPLAALGNCVRPADGEKVFSSARKADLKNLGNLVEGLCDSPIQPDALHDGNTLLRQMKHQLRKMNVVHNAPTVEMHVRAVEDSSLDQNNVVTAVPASNARVLIAVMFMVCVAALLIFSGTQPHIRFLETIVEARSSDAKILWKTDIPCYSTVVYSRDGREFSATGARDFPTEYFEATIRGLQNDNEYQYYLIAASRFAETAAFSHLVNVRGKGPLELGHEAEGLVISPPMSFRTAVAVVLTSFSVVEFDREVDIHWTTNQKTDTTLEVRFPSGEVKQYSDPAAKNLSGVTNHTISIKGLEPDSSYEATVLSTTYSLFPETIRSLPQPFLTKAKGLSRDVVTARDDEVTAGEAFIDNIKRRVDGMAEDEQEAIKENLREAGLLKVSEIPHSVKNELLTEKTTIAAFNLRLKKLNDWVTVLNNRLKEEGITVAEDDNRFLKRDIVGVLQQQKFINPEKACLKLDKAAVQVNAIESRYFQ